MLEAERRAIGYVNEIVSDYSHSAVRFADLALTRLWTQLYDGVEVHNFSTVRELAKTMKLFTHHVTVATLTTYYCLM